MFCEDEKENLCAQLTQQDQALESIQNEIEECHRAKKEYLEIIIQMQSKGRYLKKQNQLYNPKMIQIEIEALRASIKCKENDAKSLHLKMAKSNYGEFVENSVHFQGMSRVKKISL